MPGLTDREMELARVLLGGATPEQRAELFGHAPFVLDRELSIREAEVLRCMMLGLSSAEIAARLRISPRTVEVHRLHISKKLGAANTADVVRKATLAGL